MVPLVFLFYIYIYLNCNNNQGVFPVLKVRWCDVINAMLFLQINSSFSEVFRIDIIFLSSLAIDLKTGILLDLY